MLQHLQSLLSRGTQSQGPASRPADGPSAATTAASVASTAAAMTTTRVAVTAPLGAGTLGLAPPYAWRSPRVSRASTRGPSRWQWGCLAMLSRDRLKYVLIFSVFLLVGSYRSRRRTAAPFLCIYFRHLLACFYLLFPFLSKLLFFLL